MISKLVLIMNVFGSLSVLAALMVSKYLFTDSERVFRPVRVWSDEFRKNIVKTK